jgi:hypothetical protein
MGVVVAAELNDVALPVAALTEEFVDLVVEVAEAVLAETLVLDLGDLGADLTEDLRVPTLGVGEVGALGGEVGPTLSRLARGRGGSRGGRGAFAERRRGGRGGRGERGARAEEAGGGQSTLGFRGSGGRAGMGVAVAEVGGMRGEQAGVRGWLLRQRR